MKFKIDDLITKRNIEYAIKYLYDSDNISHQAIIIYQLNNSGLYDIIFPKNALVATVKGLAKYNFPGPERP